MKEINKRIAWNKGKKFSDKTRKLMSLKTKERVGNKNNFYGKKHTIETKEKISKANKGKVPWNKDKKGIYTEETIEKMRIARIGKKLSPETRLKLSTMRMGDNNVAKRPDVKEKISLSKKGKKRAQFSKEWIENIRLSSIGRKMSEESKQKLRLKRIGKNNPFYGKHHTEETKSKMFPTYQKLKKYMKEYRKLVVIPIKDTKIEVKIQNYLKELGYTFFTHQYMKEIEHGYQCDILIPSLNLVIECDGVYWHKYPIGREIDHIRTKELINKGFKVLRLWEIEINALDIQEFQKRLEKIKNTA